MVTFKAVAVNTCTIPKYNIGGIITNHPVSFVELNPDSAKDKYTMKRIPMIWGKRGGDASLISDSFELSGNYGYDSGRSRYFALTKQKEDVCELKPIKILGIAQTTDVDRSASTIDFIQVNPFYQHGNYYSEFANVGKTILESIIKAIPNKNISLYSPKETVGFFLKQGFKAVDDINSPMILMQLRK